jgi:hypothetical protein
MGNKNAASGGASLFQGQMSFFTPRCQLSRAAPLIKTTIQDLILKGTRKKASGTS